MLRIPVMALLALSALVSSAAPAVAGDFNGCWMIRSNTTGVALYPAASNYFAAVGSRLSPFLV